MIRYIFWREVSIVTHPRYDGILIFYPQLDATLGIWIECILLRISGVNFPRDRVFALDTKYHITFFTRLFIHATNKLFLSCCVIPCLIQKQSIL